MAFGDKLLGVFQDFQRRQTELAGQITERRLGAPQRKQERRLREAQITDIESRTAERSKPDPLAGIKGQIKRNELIIQEGRIEKDKFEEIKREFDLTASKEDRERETIEFDRAGILFDKKVEKLQNEIDRDYKILGRAAQVPEDVQNEFDIQLMNRFSDRLPEHEEGKIPALADVPKTPDEVRALLSKKDQGEWNKIRNKLRSLWTPEKRVQDVINEVFENKIPGLLEGLSGDKVSSAELSERLFGGQSTTEKLLPIGEQGETTQLMPQNEQADTTQGLPDGSELLPQGAQIDTTLRLPGGIEVYGLPDGRRGFISPTTGEFKILVEEQ